MALSALIGRLVGAICVLALLPQRLDQPQA
jgi:hypothetical protein